MLPRFFFPLAAEKRLKIKAVSNRVTASMHPNHIHGVIYRHRVTSCASSHLNASNYPAMNWILYIGVRCLADFITDVTFSSKPLVVKCSWGKVIKLRCRTSICLKDYLAVKAKYPGKKNNQNLQQITYQEQEGGRENWSRKLVGYAFCCKFWSAILLGCKYP